MLVSGVLHSIFFKHKHIVSIKKVGQFHKHTEIDLVLRKKGECNVKL